MKITTVWALLFSTAALVALADPEDTTIAPNDGNEMVDDVTNLIQSFGKLCRDTPTLKFTLDSQELACECMMARSFQDNYRPETNEGLDVGALQKAIDTINDDTLARALIVYVFVGAGSEAAMFCNQFYREATPEKPI